MIHRLSPSSSPFLLRLVLVLAAIFVVLAVTYATLAHRRYAYSNDIVGALVKGDSAGQSFVSRYSDLGGIEVHLGTYGRGAGSKATLVMHLRAAPGPGPDLATAVLPASQPVDENAWYTFRFPPLHNSQDKAYYVEIDSPDASVSNVLTLYWWRADPNLPSDPYPRGNAYHNGVLQNGDLAFGLYYSGAPLGVFLQMARAAAGAAGKPAIAIVGLGVVALLAYTFFFLPRTLRDQQRRARWLARWSLPFVLAVTLVNGLLFVLLTPPWQGPDESGHFAYVALLERNGLDDRRVDALEWWPGGKDRQQVVEMKNALVASLDRYHWTLYQPGDPQPGGSAMPQGPTDAYTEFVWQLHQPPTYYWLCAAAVRAARFFNLIPDHFVSPEATLMVMRCVSLALGLVVVALAWLAGRLLSIGRIGRWLQVILPLTIGLLPMHAFVFSTGDNDIMAEVSTAALFVALVALLRFGRGWRGAGLAALVLVLTLSSVATKGTAVAAGVPLAGLGLLLWVGMLASSWLTRRWEAALVLARGSRTGTTAPRIVAPLMVLVLALGLLTVAALIVFRPSDTAAGWQIEGLGPSGRAARTDSPPARDGRYSLQVEPGQTVFQWVDLPPLPRPPMSLTLSLWARGDPEESKSKLPVIGVLLDERGRVPRIGAEETAVTQVYTTVTTAADNWTPAVLTTTAGARDRKMMVRLVAGDKPLDIDGMSLRLSPPAAPPQALAGPANSPPNTSLTLFNPSAEIGALSLSPIVQRLLPDEQIAAIDVLVNPQAFDKEAVVRRYAYRQFRSFWGNFGWTAIPMDESVYTIINWVIGLGLVGLALSTARRIGRWSWREWLGIVSLAALVLTIVEGFGKQMASLPNQGVHTDPAGRYLFVLLVPVCWLLITGLSAIAGLVTRTVRWARPTIPAIRNPKSAFRNPPVPWLLWLLSSAVAVLLAYSLLALIAPYYYG